MYMRIHVHSTYLHVSVHAIGTDKFVCVFCCVFCMCVCVCSCVPYACECECVCVLGKGVVSGWN